MTLAIEYSWTVRAFLVWIHLKNRSQEFKCEWPFCNASFRFAGLLREHSRIHKNKPFRCSLCPYTNCKFRHMVDHSNMHLKVFTYKCADCEKSFARSSDITVHRLIHHSEIKYYCKICNESIKNKKLISRHVRLKHKINHSFADYLSSYWIKLLLKNYYKISIKIC